MNAVCAGRHSSLPHVSSAAVVSRLQVSNTKSMAGTLSLVFLPFKGYLSLATDPPSTPHSSLKRLQHSLNCLLSLTGRSIGGLVLLNVILFTQKLIDSVLARNRLIFIEILDDLRLKTV